MAQPWRVDLSCAVNPVPTWTSPSGASEAEPDPGLLGGRPGPSAGRLGSKPPGWEGAGGAGPSDVGSGVGFSVADGEGTGAVGLPVGAGEVGSSVGSSVGAGVVGSGDGSSVTDGDGTGTVGASVGAGEVGSSQRDLVKLVLDVEKGGEGAERMLGKGWAKKASVGCKDD